MSSNITHVYDTIVIGGGQAGLACGYYLSLSSRSFVILDASQRIGDVWRSRWDSLRLFTTARVNKLPGMKFPIPTYSYPTKDQVADYLEAYAAHFHLPVENGVRVERLGREDERYLIEVGEGHYEASNVIVAMSSHQIPHEPTFAEELDSGIVQMHSSRYRNPGQLQDGTVLVVGAGNSGAEIALDVRPQHKTILAGNYPPVIPFNLDKPFGRYIFMSYLFPFVGKHLVTTNTPIGRRMKPRVLEPGAPLFRAHPNDIDKAGIEHVGRVGGVQDGLPVLEDGRIIDVANVIWATGYRPSFHWIDLEIFGGEKYAEEPVHDRGVVEGKPGLYFVGLEFLYSLGSSVLAGVGRDAKYVVDHLTAR